MGVGVSGEAAATSPELAVEMLRRMLLVREFEGLLPRLYNEGLSRGSSHPAIGQEAVAVGRAWRSGRATSSRARTGATATRSPRAATWSG